MYFTTLPDHSQPGFNESEHFSKFRKHNIIYNAVSSDVHCDAHVGCLSLKTALSGEEWYGVQGRQLAVRPGQFLILNDCQDYSCRITQGEPVRSVSIFFKNEFASSVFHDAVRGEENLLEHPFPDGEMVPEFFQTLHPLDHALRSQLRDLITSLEGEGYDSFRVDEHLVFLLRLLIGVHRSDARKVLDVKAIKSATRTEIFRRLCVARDFLHTNYMQNLDLSALSGAACMSVPQLIRQFKGVFHATPHQYLVGVRLQHAEELLKRSDLSVAEITWACGFENASAFCRSFKAAHGLQPGRFRKTAPDDSL